MFRQTLIITSTLLSVCLGTVLPVGQTAIQAATPHLTPSNNNLPLTLDAPLTDWTTSRDGKYIYALVRNELLYINATTLKIEHKRYAGSGTADIELGPDDRLYIAQTEATSLNVIDTGHGALLNGPLTSIELGRTTNRIALAGDKIFYIDSYYNDINVYDRASGHNMDIGSHFHNNRYSFSSPDIKADVGRDLLYIGEGGTSGGSITALNMTDYSFQSETEGYGFMYPPSNLVVQDGTSVYYAGRRMNADKVAQIYGSYMDQYIIGTNGEYVFTTKAVYLKNTYSKLFDLPYKVEHMISMKDGSMLMHIGNDIQEDPHQGDHRIYSFKDMDAVKQLAQDHQMPPYSTTVDSFGSNVLNVNPARTDWEPQVQAVNSDKITIHSVNPERLDKLDVFLSKEMVTEAGRASKPIELRTREFTLNFPVALLQEETSENGIRFRVMNANAQERVPYNPSDAHEKSEYYHFEMTLGDDNSAPMDLASYYGLEIKGGKDSPIKHHPVELTMFYDPWHYNKTERLHFFGYQNYDRDWAYIGGQRDTEAHTLTAPIQHRVMVMLEYKKTFDDIRGHWAQQPIEHLIGRQVVSGTTRDTFSPGGKVTRAEFVSMLSRALGLRGTVTDGSFRDVPPKAWYSKDVYAAVIAGITQGITGSQFGSNDTLTREQMAVMLVNAYRYKSVQTAEPQETTEAGVLSESGKSFLDSALISAWAQSSVKESVSLGFISGGNDNRFEPKGLTTRAQAAVVLAKLVEE
ncbi:hypothetical protein SY83_21995 [Paenibacillus swuensis]|uniref:SLH domain-containing protein n=1 Tax=Paenibacillus swuensis TaxID=1178515 RepID=A0A172TNF7_9BACL|nr:S-layer homology domain-containing protein [Paenibacillus swuensis]ANE48512.1 hypothetical protein SY83_21995 [Paenibacillus swuensis]